MTFIIDIHSHIIPNIDDGAKSLEVTLEMLKNAEKDGTKKIVATPHYYRGHGEANIDEVKDYVYKLNNMVNEYGIDLEIYSGQEVHCSDSIIKDLKSGLIGTINDSRYMLIEFDFIRLEKHVFNMIYELQISNIIPIIAHPERYLYLIKKPYYINKFIEEGCLFQLDGGSLEGQFGKQVRKTAEIFTSNGVYNFIGSDAHNNKNRNTGLSNSINLANRKNNKIKDIFKVSSERLLKNKLIGFKGHKIKEKSSYFF